MNIGQLQSQRPLPLDRSRFNFLIQRRHSRLRTAVNAELASNMTRNDLGEREATQAETMSNFSDKPLGFYDTAHVVRGPDGLIHLVGLSARECKADAALLSESDINKLRNQVPGWKLLHKDGVPYLRQEWTVIDQQSGKDLFSRVSLVAEEAGHKPVLQMEGDDRAIAELSSQSLGGLTENDFIVAARINAIAIKDLQPKPKMRFWA